MATRGRSITLSTSYQTAFDATTDGGPCLFCTVYASGNDVTVQLTYAGATSDEFLCASGQTFAQVGAPTGGAQRPLITKIEVKAASAAGTAYVNAGPRA